LVVASRASRAALTARRFPRAGLSKNKRCALLCETTTANSLPTFISRMSRGGDRPLKLLTRDEARRIAVNIAKFPEF